MLQKMRDAANKLKEQTAALFLAWKRKDTPVLAKIAAILAVGYALSPIDLIPDFIPVLGLLDDLLVLPPLIFIAVKLIPADIMKECAEEARGMWRKGKPKRWYCAIPIVLIWLAALYFIIKAIVR